MDAISCWPNTLGTVWLSFCGDISTEACMYSSEQRFLSDFYFLFFSRSFLVPFLGARGLPASISGMTGSVLLGLASLSSPPLTGRLDTSLSSEATFMLISSPPNVYRIDCLLGIHCALVRGGDGQRHGLRFFSFPLARGPAA